MPALELLVEECLKKFPWQKVNILKHDQAPKGRNLGALRMCNVHTASNESHLAPNEFLIVFLHYLNTHGLISILKVL